LLATYAATFATAEINNSFYRLPSINAVAAWRQQVPDGFVFAVKGSRFVTHYRKLRDVGDSIKLILERLEPLGDAFGPLLWQLPPFLKPDIGLLAEFLDALPESRRQTIEFRDPAWYSAATFHVLADHDTALCISDHAAAPAPFEATASFVYLRGHGPGGRYFGSYATDMLQGWADRIMGWQGEGRSVFVYFDNDVGAAAPADAQRLITVLKERGGAVIEPRAEAAIRR
jgi:uncharacterized protein YecE (DUF72 family)